MSIDGFVDHDRFAPDPQVFRHFVNDIQSVSGSLYGRRMYEVMRYWDEDRPEWGVAERAYATGWRAQPKWVVSRTLESVGPNASLVPRHLTATVSDLKTTQSGIIEVSGPTLACSMADLGLVDEFRLYVHPVVLGSGKPFFTGPRPRLRLTASDRIGKDVIRLTYAPA